MSTPTYLNVTFTELCRCVSLSEDQLLSLVEEELLVPVQGESREQWVFSHTAASLASRAERLHLELLVAWADVPLVLTLLEEINALRLENQALKQRLQRFESQTD